MVDQIKVAGVQTNPKILKKKENLVQAIEMIRDAVENKAKLIIFPECALTGYCYSSIEEANISAEPINGASIQRIGVLSKELDVYVVMGFLETDGSTIFNSLAFTGPDGLIGRYRKIHLPFLGVDRFLSPGNEPFKVYDTKVGKIGMNICYDSSFPESSRVLALKGAELIVLSTNWPKGVEYYPRYVVHTRAIENRVNYAAINRTGVERGIRFCGLSKIVDSTGKTLAETGKSKEEIIYAWVDLAKARNKKSIKIPGEWETDRIMDRRPEFYTKISDPKTPAEPR
jgi:predicted amidohydrolase